MAKVKSSCRQCRRNNKLKLLKRLGNNRQNRARAPSSMSPWIQGKVLGRVNGFIVSELKTKNVELIFRNVTNSTLGKYVTFSNNAGETGNVFGEASKLNSERLIGMKSAFSPESSPETVHDAKRRKTADNKVTVDDADMRKPTSAFRNRVAIYSMPDSVRFSPEIDVVSVPRKVYPRTPSNVGRAEQPDDVSQIESGDLLNTKSNMEDRISLEKRFADSENSVDDEQEEGVQRNEIENTPDVSTVEKSSPRLRDPGTRSVLEPKASEENQSDGTCNKVMSEEKTSQSSNNDQCGGSHSQMPAVKFSARLRKKSLANPKVEDGNNQKEQKKIHLKKPDVPETLPRKDNASGKSSNDSEMHDLQLSSVDSTLNTLGLPDQLPQTKSETSVLLEKGNTQKGTPASGTQKGKQQKNNRSTSSGTAKLSDNNSDPQSSQQIEKTPAPNVRKARKSNEFKTNSTNSLSTSKSSSSAEDVKETPVRVTRRSFSMIPSITVENIPKVSKTKTPNIKVEPPSTKAAKVVPRTSRRSR